jgi:uncharacterized protein GlcG (DUF336 family)
MTKLVKTLTLSDAKAMTHAAEEHAATFGVQFSVAVVDHGGHLVHFIRDDAVVAGYIDLAINKAYTAVAFGRTTHGLAPMAQPGGELFGIQHSLNGRTVVFGGGIPVYSDGVVIGAVGASAGTVEQDISVGLAAASAWSDQAENTPVSSALTSNDISRGQTFKNKLTASSAARR